MGVDRTVNFKRENRGGENTIGCQDSTAEDDASAGKATMSAKTDGADNRGGGRHWIPKRPVPGAVELQPIDRFPEESICRGVVNPDGLRKDPRTPSTALNGLIAGCCCGWRTRPTADEMEAAIKSRKSTARNRCLARVVLGEARPRDILRAEAEGAFSFQDLAWWIQETGNVYRKQARWINAVGISWWIKLQKTRDNRRRING